MERTYQINEYSVTRAQRRRQRIGMLAIRGVILIAGLAWALRPVAQ